MHLHGGRFSLRRLIIVLCIFLFISPHISLNIWILLVVVNEVVCGRILIHCQICVSSFRDSKTLLGNSLLAQRRFLSQKERRLVFLDRCLIKFFPLVEDICDLERLDLLVKGQFWRGFWILFLCVARESIHLHKLLLRLLWILSRLLAMVLQRFQIRRRTFHDRRLLT